MKRVVLDTSALFTLIENEEGCEYIEQLIEGALKDEYQLYLSVIAKIELYYISVQEQSVEVAKKRMELIDDLPINIIEVKENLIETIGNYKANYSISFEPELFITIYIVSYNILLNICLYYYVEKMCFYDWYE